MKVGLPNESVTSYESLGTDSQFVPIGTLFNFQSPLFGPGSGIRVVSDSDEWITTKVDPVVT